jgi:hypothetical protein
MEYFVQLTIRVNGVPHVIHEDDFEMKVTSNGYIRAKTPYGSTLESILTFPQVVACIEEEKREWWREA